MRVISFMLAATYALSVISTPQREVGDHVHRASAHAAVEQRFHLAPRVRRGHPQVVRPGILLLFRADEGQVLDARHVRRMRPVQVAARERGLVELEQGAGGLHLPDELAILVLGAVAPVHTIRAGEARDFIDPGAQLRGCLCRGRETVCCGRHACLSIEAGEFTSPPPKGPKLHQSAGESR
jgi:hypothetical protein